PKSPGETRPVLSTPNPSAAQPYTPIQLCGPGAARKPGRPCCPLGAARTRGACAARASPGPRHSGLSAQGVRLPPRRGRECREWAPAPWRTLPDMPRGGKAYFFILMQFGGVNGDARQSRKTGNAGALGLRYVFYFKLLSEMELFGTHGCEIFRPEGLHGLVGSWYSK